MKLRVEGIEEILITDPKGACKLAALPALPPALPALPSPSQGQPVQPSPGQWGIPWQPSPQLPTPFGPSPIVPIPGAGDVAVPHKTGIYTRHVHDPNDPLHRAKWGVGGPMIQQAAQEVDPAKWEKNWQASMTGGEDRIDGNQYTS